MSDPEDVSIKLIEVHSKTREVDTVHLPELEVRW